MEAGAALGLDFHPESIEVGPGDSVLLEDNAGEKEEEEEEVDVENSVVEMNFQSMGTEFAFDGGVQGKLELEMEPSEPYAGMEFDSLESARKFYFDYAERVGFRVRNNRFRTSRRDDSIIMRRFVCYKEGFYLKNEKRKNDGKERRNRASIREGCKAMFEVVRKDKDRWVVTKLIIEHNHAFVANIRASKLMKKRAPLALPVEMSSLFGGGFGAEERPNPVWGGGEAFNLLQYFKKMQTMNPAFFYSIEVDETNKLKNVFWADAKARMAYSYFGDVVALDTTYKKNRLMMPFVLFTGVNHHLQPVVFGCSVLLDETEASYIWLFETFLVAMSGRLPVSFVTDHCKALAAAAMKVFHGTHHRFCKWRILSKCKEKLLGICSTQAARASLKGDMKKCIDETDTVQDFESSWEAFLLKYNLRDNEWIQSLYEVRQQWATVYLKDKFFAEMSPSQRSESMNKFFQRTFETRTSLFEFVAKFDQAIAGQYEKEVQADFANMIARPVLKSSSSIEKHASETYTKTIFSIFQEELVQALGYSVEKFQDGSVCRYHVALNAEGAHRTYDVTFDSSETRARCSCQKFEFSGIICRHILRVFQVVGLCKLPEGLILKRWTQKAKSGTVLYENCAKIQGNAQNNFTHRCNNLFLDVLKHAAEGATSLVTYKAAKDALQKAFAEVVSAKMSLWSTKPGNGNYHSEWGLR
ncbi:protein FAR1-RELATED SEQUENCE 5 [Cocos nucifera]|nr:protein FAR1-RELATED SEQUENCE 5 [Cocos nucifera]